MILYTQTFVNMLMYHHPLLSEVNKPTHTVSSFQLILLFYSMTCTGGCGYSFWYSCWLVLWHPEIGRVTLQWINICILLHLVGILNYGARNHELKIYLKSLWASVTLWCVHDFVCSSLQGSVIGIADYMNISITLLAFWVYCERNCVRKKYVPHWYCYNWF